MRITLLTHGTRGDVQPFLALAIALKEAGHEPLLTAPENFQTFVESAGIRFLGYAGDMQKFISSPEISDILERGDARAFMKAYAEACATHFAHMDQRSLEACRDAELIVSSMNTFEDAFSIAEKRQVPLCLVSLCPTIPATGEYPHPLFLQKVLPLPLLNRLSYRLFERLHWSNFEESVNGFRGQLELPPIRQPLMKLVVDRKVPILHAFSPTLCPPPRDWAGENCVTGFFVAPPTLREKTDPAPPPELVKWLAAGDRPVFVGFGSAPTRDTEKLLSLVSDVAGELGVRAIVATGWSPPAVQSSSDQLWITRSVNFEWLFPQCRAVVHAGGAGVTHTGLRAGVPALVTAFHADQPYWGAQIERKGLGTWFRYRDLNRQRLLEGLKRCLKPEVVSQAREASKKALAEGDGISKAVAYIEALALK